MTTNDFPHAFAQIARTAADIQDALTVGQIELPNCLKSLRNDVPGEIGFFELSCGFIGEFEPSHLHLNCQTLLRPYKEMDHEERFICCACNCGFDGSSMSPRVQKPQAEIAFADLTSSRSMNFWIFPVEVFGIGPNTTAFGVLKPGI